MKALPSCGKFSKKILKDDYRYPTKTFVKKRQRASLSCLSVKFHLLKDDRRHDKRGSLGIENKLFSDEN